jgi:hypothetical protein
MNRNSGGSFTSGIAQLSSILPASFRARNSTGDVGLWQAQLARAGQQLQSACCHNYDACPTAA